MQSTHSTHAPVDVLEVNAELDYVSGARRTADCTVLVNVGQVDLEMTTLKHVFIEKNIEKRCFLCNYAVPLTVFAGT